MIIYTCSNIRKETFMNYEEIFNEYLTQNNVTSEETTYKELWTEYHDGSDNNGWSETNPNF